jgi:xanthine dehydrogenase iron-sulfur cluster and FAD-binding subunit A
MLDGAIRRAGVRSPHWRVVEFPREPSGRTETREGCADGDCGASTVVLAEHTREDGRYWRPIHARFGPPTISERSGSPSPPREAWCRASPAPG